MSPDPSDRSVASRLGLTKRVRLQADHATAVAFVDETGTIARDRFFAVGCLVMPEPSEVLRQIQKWRDRHHEYGEIKWVDLTRSVVPLRAELFEIVATSSARFSCFVVDREVSDPVARFGQDSWLAYQKLAEQLLIASVKPHELLSVLADNYSTPDDVEFEKDIRREANRRLGRLAVTTVCRLDSRSCDGLQLVDLLTGAVAFEHRQAAGLAGSRTPKASAAAAFRAQFGIETTIGGCKSGNLNVKLYVDSQPKAA